MNITTVGLDIAKRTFHVVCCNTQGRVIKKKMLSRSKVLMFFTQLPQCLVAIEACATSNYWARSLQDLGHQVKLIPPRQVKSFLTGNKNDYNDALAISVAARQPHISGVEVKTVEQQDSQAQHKARELAVRQRTSLCNQIRGLIAEYGLCIPQGINSLQKILPELLSNENQYLSDHFKMILFQLKQQLEQLTACITAIEQLIKDSVKQNPISMRLQSIPGIGPMIASAFFNKVGNGQSYRRGRDVSASLGLVPKQHSSGGKEILLGISKRGDAYLRCLLIQGAKSVVSRAKFKQDKLSLWLNRLVATRGHNRACVAYANKMARMAWAITISGEQYKPA